MNCRLHATCLVMAACVAIACKDGADRRQEPQEGSAHRVAPDSVREMADTITEDSVRAAFDKANGTQLRVGQFRRKGRTEKGRKGELGWEVLTTYEATVTNDTQTTFRDVRLNYSFMYVCREGCERERWRVTDYKEITALVPGENSVQVVQMEYNGGNSLAPDFESLELLSVGKVH